MTQQNRIQAEVLFSTDREAYNGVVVLSQGWVYLEDEDVYIPSESVRQVSGSGQQPETLL